MGEIRRLTRNWPSAPTQRGGLVLALLLATGCGEIRPTELPLIEFSEPLEIFPATLSGAEERVHELPDGRVAVMERFVPSVTILDWATGSQVRSGRHGRGPGEFEQPHALLLVHPDTLVLLEAVGRKIHFFTTAGEFVRSGLLPPGPFYVTAPLFADTTGWIYLSNRGSVPLAVEAGADSLGVFRFRAGHLAADSVWTIGTSPLLQMPTDRGAAIMPLVFSDQDAIGVSADGRVIRASARLQQFHRWQDGVFSPLGAPWGLPPARVTQRDRDSVTTELAAIRIYRGIKLSFADRKAVFDKLVVAPSGEAWLRLTEPRAGKQVYRVFAADGTPRFDVAPPPGSVLVGVGAAHVYFLRDTEEGDQLIRVPAPAGSAPSGQ